MSFASLAPVVAGVCSCTWSFTSFSRFTLPAFWTTGPRVASARPVGTSGSSGIEVGRWRSNPCVSFGKNAKMRCFLRPGNLDPKEKVGVEHRPKHTKAMRMPRRSA